MAVIALIATPIVLDVIEDTKLSAAKSETKIIADSINNYCAAAAMEVQMDSTKENICEDGVTIEEVSQMTKLNKSVVESIEYSNGRVQTLTVKSNGKSITYDGSTGEVEQPVITCKRATTLHTEECTNIAYKSVGCRGAGYTADGTKKTTTITYGSLGVSGTLTSGDAFDCDVNGDGNYDATSERFYYLSDYYNTATNEYETDTAVLIYYNYVLGGTPDEPTATVAYNDNESDSIFKGPNKATEPLPKTSQWSNVSLKNTVRNIQDQSGTTQVENFDYGQYSVAARLLNAKEIYAACGTTVKDGPPTGQFDSCIYLFETTPFSTPTESRLENIWIENLYYASGSSTRTAWNISSTERAGFSQNSDDSSYSIVKPVIEVPKKNIIYK